MSLRIFNTLTNQKQAFKPIHQGKVGMYVCGITAYDMCHIGHARAYISADIVFRYLTHKGFDVTYVRNFTDIDDKIINRAHKLQISTKELANRFINEFYKDMDSLRVLRPQIEPKATKHIPDIIRTINSLINRGHAYQVDGDIFFDVGSWRAYGALSKRNLNEMKAGARIDIDPRKRSALDFVLWKSSKLGEPEWESPWGKGRPGWHIECSTMSTKYLGQPFDIHGGGKDLVFPHHENEIAQSEAAYGKKFAHVFIHNGFVNIDKEKMSKSLGNFFTIRDVTARYTAEALRYFLLTTHYRSPINFEVLFICPYCHTEIDRYDVEQRKCSCCGVEMSESDASRAVNFSCLEEARRRLTYLYTTKKRLQDFLSEHTSFAQDNVLYTQELLDLIPRFSEAMDDDFNAARALGVLSDAAHLTNEVLDNKEGYPKNRVASTLSSLYNVFEEMSDVLGIMERDPAQALASFQQSALILRGVDQSEVTRLVCERDAARRAKNFARADTIRTQLWKIGIELMDSPKGTTWNVL